MKKFIIIFVALLITLPAFAGNKGNSFAKNKPLITDELIEHKSFVNKKSAKKIVHTPIIDELLEPKKNKASGLFMLNAYKSDPLLKIPISDELISSDFIAKSMEQAYN